MNKKHDLEDRNEPAIVCFKHGRVVLTKEEYNTQLNRPDSRWECPKCGECPVRWDGTGFYE